MARFYPVFFLALLLLGGCDSFRSDSKNAALEQLSLADAVLEPGFSPDVLQYSATVGSSVNSTSVSAIAASGKAKVAINGSAPQRGPASATVALNAGVNTITVVVTAESGRQRTYTVEVTRPESTYSIGGSVSGLSGDLTLRNNGGDDLEIAADGPFAFATEIADGSNYSVSVAGQPDGQECSVENGSGTVDGADVTAVSVTCAATELTVGGTLTGLTGSVTLQNNGGDDLVLTENGAFVFATPMDEAAAYDITVSSQPENQQCTVSGGAGTISGADVTSVNVQCSGTGTFRITGTVNGLVGTGVLQLNGTENLLMAKNGPFFYFGLFQDGADYEVTVLTQPAGQTCTVANGSGTIAGAGVSDVRVDCAGAGAVTGSLFDWEWVNPRPQGNGVLDFASDGSLAVAVGGAGLVMTSTDGVDWVVRDSGTGESLRSVTWGGGEFIAVGSGGAVTTSPDGVTWQSQSLGNIELAGIEWDGSKYVAVGNEFGLTLRAVAVTSTDGATWSVQTLAEFDPMSPRPVEGLAWSGSRFVATALFGTVYTSADGIAWTPVQVQPDLINLRIASDGTRFVLVANDATVYTSVDGSVWTPEAAAFPGAFIDRLTWDGSRFLATAVNQFITSPDASTWTVNTVSAGNLFLGAVTRFAGRNVVASADGAIYTSPDDSSWSTEFAAETTRLWDVTWDGSQFVGVGTGPAIRTSPDGTNWTTRLETDPLAAIMLSVTFAGGQYVAVGNGLNSQSQVLTSPDAITWTSRSIAIDNLSLVDVAWGDGTYVAVNKGGTLLTSPDGVSWTESARLLDNTGAFSELSGVEWNGSLWVVTGREAINNGVAGYLWTSPDASTWTRQVIPGGRIVGELAWNGSRFVAVGSAVATSVDGLSWTFLTSQLGWQDISWNGSKFIAVGFGAEILESTDGLTWSVSRSKSGFNLAVASGGGATVVLGLVNVGTIITRSEP